MAIYSGPEIPSSGLIFNVDPANPKNFGLNSVQVLVVGGGGAGAQDFAGGGGGGGVVYNSNFSVTPGAALTVTVGAGGARPVNGSTQGAGTTAQGSNSVFGSITANGGGAGAGSAAIPNAGNGGSGGGGGGGKTAGTGTAGQGFAGASTASGVGGGGGGAGGPGLTTGAGGPGLQFDISGTPTFYGGGGGGTNDVNFAAPGGIGGGGTNGGFQATSNNGIANTGGGGSAYYGNWGGAGNGGSGIVIVRYAGPQRAIGGTVTRVGNDTVHTFTSVGSTTFTPLSSSTITGLSDFAGTSKFATANGGLTYDSSHLGGITFSGNSTYLSLPSSTLNGLTSWTIEFWLKRDSANSIDTILTCGAGNDFLWYFSGGTTLTVENAGSTASTAFSYSNGTTFHFVATGSGGSASIYKDGSFLSNITIPTTITVNSTIGILIGQEMDSNAAPGSIDSTQSWKGKLYKSSFYNRVLSATEVKLLFEASRDRFGV